MAELCEYLHLARKPNPVSSRQMIRIALIGLDVPHSKMCAAADAAEKYMESHYTNIQTAANAVAGDYQ